MNLQSLIRPELWLAISNTYEVENYSHAVFDAFQYMSQVIREKSGLDGDGEKLVGAAFGGKTPLLRINKLQTETERDAQQGLVQILIGMYKGIRNPIVHEQIEDTKNTADAIIYFIDYLLSIIDKSQEPFTIPGFVSRVFDKYFVQSSEYAKLLVEEIPPKRRFDVLIEIYRRKQEGDGYNLSLVIKEILKLITEEQITQFLGIVSDELKTTQDDTIIKLILQVLPPELWKKLNKSARLRAENILLKSIKEGAARFQGSLIDDAGWLGIWARDFLHYFEHKIEVERTILKKLTGECFERKYVIYFFLNELPILFKESILNDNCIQALCKAVKECDYDHELEGYISKNYWLFPEDWQNFVKNELPDLDIEDDIPF